VESGCADGAWAVVAVEVWAPALPADATKNAAPSSSLAWRSRGFMLSA